MLPVAHIADELAASLADGNIILSAPPGAGKSTYLPLALLAAPWLDNKKILMLQPRRVAARSIASYLASQLSEPVGKTIGYRIRGESRVSAHTRLEILTEGLLTRRLQSDPELAAVALVIFDEFHERNLQGDLALAFTLESQQALREDLRLLVMSATLDVGPIHRLLPDARVMGAPGRQFPIEYYYRPFSRNQHLLDAMADCVAEALDNQQGGVLAFLPGKGEINQLANRLAGRLPSMVDLYPLHGDLDKAQQIAALAKVQEGRRKLVLATNVAETSLTIDGISIVIDSGLERSAHYDLKRGITELSLQRISQASSVQRAGRAGRTQAGVCYRLWGKERQDRLERFSVPEILRTDLCQAVLEARQWGVGLEELALLDAPAKAQIDAATSLLTRIAALDDKSRLTPLGRRLVTLGTHPRLGMLLLGADSLAAHLEVPVAQLLGHACLLVALLEGGGVKGETDIVAQLQQTSRSIMPQAANWARKFNVALPVRVQEELIAPLLMLGFPDWVAKHRGGGRYLLANGTGASLEGDLCQSRIELIVIAHLLLVGEDKADARIAMAAAVEAPTLALLPPAHFSEEIRCDWLAEEQKIVARRVRRLGAIELMSQPCKATPDGVANLWQRILKEQGLPLSEAAHSLLNRLALAQKELADVAPWPVMTAQSLAENVEDWLLPHIRDIRTLDALKKLDWSALIRQQLDWPVQQALNDWLPESFTLPTGRRCPLSYDDQRNVRLSARMQELYGQRSHPSVGKGRITVLVELLSPARRPIQLTRDLPGFWQGSYQEVKKEMKGRYSKHFWPDDPANAPATAGTKRSIEDKL